MKRDNVREPKECVWKVDGIDFAGLEWGPTDGVPVLALHGWMDHAGSFEVLAPRFSGCRVVAIDLSGQGLSGHRAAHASYNIWDDLPQIVGLLELLGWADCVLMGHSRGANIATLFAAAQPERVRALIAIESLLPEPAAPDSFVPTVRAFVEQSRSHGARPFRTFATRADYISRRTSRGNSVATAEALSRRALEPVAGGMRMRGDRRLFASSAMRLTRADLESVLRALACPVLNIWATGGIRGSRPAMEAAIDLARAVVGTYETLDLAGDHHLHMEPGAAEQIAAATSDFLARHCQTRVWNGM